MFISLSDPSAPQTRHEGTDTRGVSAWHKSGRRVGFYPSPGKSSCFQRSFCRMKEELNSERWFFHVEVGLFELQLKCCGVDGSWDYTGSSYLHKLNPVRFIRITHVFHGELCRNNIKLAFKRNHVEIKDCADFSSRTTKMFRPQGSGFLNLVAS